LIRAVIGTSILATAAGMVWVVFGDSYLLASSNYKLLAFLWLTHLAFWILYSSVATPILAQIGGGRRDDPGRTPVAALLAGAAGVAYIVWASHSYLHKDLGFFSPLRLAGNGLLLLGLMGLAALILNLLRGKTRTVERLFWIAPALGILTAGSLWGATLWRTQQGALHLDSADLQGPFPEGSAAAHRVRVLGLDGADWRFITPLIEAGRAPAFARLRAEGVTAPMQTVSPFSPVDWTTIATGVDPARHSVQGFSEMYSPALDLTINRLNNNFLEPLYSRLFQKIPVSSATRREKALWEIVSAFGLDSLVINWWATFPVSPHRGVLISNYALPWDELSADRIGRSERIPHMVYPEELWPQVVEVLEQAVDGGIRAFPWQEESLDEEMTHVEYWDLRDRIVAELYRRFHDPAHALEMIYMQGIDTTCHHYSETIFGGNIDLPRTPRVGAEVIAAKQALVDEAYMRMDRHLGSLMDALEEGDLLVVVSDHGWNFDGTNHWRMPDGIFGLYGTGVRNGLAPERVHVYDVAPTVLRYLGLPLSRELEGRALDEAFTSEALAGLPASFVESYGPRHQALRVSDELIDAAQKRQLDSMGYR